MNEQQIQRFQALQADRPNGRRVNRLMREMYDSAADPQPLAFSLSRLAAVTLLAASNSFAAVSTLFAE